jgi:hypothetical protein
MSKKNKNKIKIKLKKKREIFPDSLADRLYYAKEEVVVL